jgi:putative peptidoglycan binding protein
MTISAPALWNDNGPDVPWKTPSVRAVLDKSRPPVLQVHAGPIWLATKGGALTTEIRAAYPGIRVWWAIAGDAYGPDPSQEWAQAATAAGAAVVTTICPDPEDWTTRPAGMLRKSVNAIRTANPTIEILPNTWAQPLRVPNVFPPPAETGYSDAYPLAELLGQGSPCNGVMRQVYYDDPDIGIPTERGRGPRSLARSTSDYAVALAEGKIRGDTALEGYQQMHGCRCDDLCTVAQSFRICGWWVLNYLKDFDADGVRAMWAVCELERRGYGGGNGIVQFQLAAGLTPDGIVGPKTLAALGVVWP